jgi:hypothetical protein
MLNETSELLPRFAICYYNDIKMIIERSLFPLEVFLILEKNFKFSFDL